MARLISLAAALLAVTLGLAACSGVETIPDDTAAFTATGFSRYAWRSDPLDPALRPTDKLYQADPIIRSSVNERMAALGYVEVPRDEAEFLLESFAGPGVKDGLLTRSASNITPYPSTTINRMADGASVDNAYALAGAVETGNILLVFVREENLEVLWRVNVSAVIQNANHVDESNIRTAMHKGLSTLPEAP